MSSRVARQMFPPEPQQMSVSPEQQAAQQTAGALPTQVDLILYSGDDFFLDVTVSNPDNSPADLTGAVILAQIRTNEASPTPLAAFASTVASNVIHLHLPGASTETSTGVAMWDLQMTKGGAVTTLVRGSVSITADVTR